jgi:predicted Rossmann fold nucleotide-binding protein DprA/Smf involved in DNA uptake
MQEPAEWRKPLADGRFLLLSFFDESVCRATADLAAKRNAYVAALADRILIAHAERGGKTEELCRDALARGKPVFTLDSPDNAHLIDLGAVPVRADNLSVLAPEPRT